MKLNLDIKDDAELRNMVKDLIRGQVKSVVKEEIMGIVKEVFFTKFATVDAKATAETFIKQELANLMKSQFKTNYYGSSVLSQMAKDAILEEVKKSMAGILPSTKTE